MAQGASFAIKNRWTVPWSNHQGDPDDLDDDPEDFFGPGVEVDVDLEDEENVRSQSFKSRLADLEEGPSGNTTLAVLKTILSFLHSGELAFGRLQAHLGATQKGHASSGCRGVSPKETK